MRAAIQTSMCTLCSSLNRPRQSTSPSRQVLRVSSREGVASLNTTAFRLFQRCQQERRTKAESEAVAIAAETSKRWSSWMVAPVVGSRRLSQKLRAKGHPKIRRSAISSATGHTGQTAVEASMIVFRRRTSRVCTLARVRSQAKKQTWEGARHPQRKSAFVAGTLPMVETA